MPLEVKQAKIGRSLSIIMIALIMGAALSYLFAAQNQSGSKSHKETFSHPDMGELLLVYNLPATEAELGAPVYPGATLVGSVAMAFAKPESQLVLGRLARATLNTNDDAAKVTEFYRSRLGDEAGTEEQENGKVQLFFLTKGESTVTVRQTTLASGQVQIEISNAELDVEDLPKIPPTPIDKRYVPVKKL